MNAPVPRRLPAALPIMADAFAAAIRPPPPLVPSKWMAEHLIVPGGPRQGGRWDPTLTPYIAEIADALAPGSPHNLVAVRKSAQTGVSIAAIGLVGSYVALAPTRIGYALPTIDALQEFNSEKLMPAVEQTPALRAKVRSQTSRTATGSTATRKKFPGGSLVLINANSVTDLKSKTLQVGVGDEVDEWVRDLEDQGDPWGLFEKRFIAFHATGDYRLLALSTPKLLGESRIDDLFNRGDRRLWHVRCPACGTEIALEFKHLQFRKAAPHQASYAAQCCGGIIEHHDKARLVRAGRFIATHAGGLYPSFYVDALVSQFTTWDKIAAEWVAAEGRETEVKKFVNQTLGLPYEVKGDAPDHVRLMERREAYPENRIPPLGLLLVAGADVQHSGIWVEVVAFAPDGQSWSLSRRFLAGDTTDPGGGAFRALGAVYDERFDDAWGRSRRLDAMAIDAGDGGRANQVYAFVRGRPHAYPVKGVPGWGRPALGTPVKVSITLRGKKLAGGSQLWPVGTWDLKAEFYANLRKDGRKAGHELDPPGYCHFGEFLDEGYFRQITAEYLVDVKVKGKVAKAWRDSGPNHLLDCRVYATALAEHLGLKRKTREDWIALAKLYSLPDAAGDLFAPHALAVERAGSALPEGGAAGSPPSPLGEGGARASPPSAGEEPEAPPASVAAALERALADKPSRPVAVRRHRFARLTSARRLGGSGD